MSRLLTSGFEVNSLSTSDALTAPDGRRNTEGTGASTYAFQSGSARSGGLGLRVVCAASVANADHQQWSFTTSASGIDLFARCYIRVTALPTTASTTHPFLALDNGTNFWYVGVTDDGRFTLKIAGFATLQTDANYIILNTWYRIEMRVRVGTGAIDQHELRVNGDSIGSSTGNNITDTLLTGLRAGIRCGAGVGSGGGSSWDLDDIALNDSFTSPNNSWPDEGRIVLLSPATDSAVGTGWTLGTGTATGGNAHGSVDNEPPLGVADLAVGSDPKQIRNAASSANSNYDATMTSYTGAGLGTNDTVTIVTPIVATAAPVSTSAKQGTVGVVSNPAIANIALAAGGTSGAFWSGTAGGTYPSGWKWSYGTITSTPSVTLGTAPVMRITQVTSSTRIAVVCFMGMYVEYVSHPSDPLEACLSRRSPTRRGVLTRKV